MSVIKIGKHRITVNKKGHVTTVRTLKKGKTLTLDEFANKIKKEI